MEQLDSLSLTPPPETQQSLKLHFQTVLHKRRRASVERVCYADVGESTVYWPETIKDCFNLLPSNGVTNEKECNNMLRLGVVLSPVAQTRTDFQMFIK